jgi:hypothetical protein
MFQRNLLATYFYNYDGRSNTSERSVQFYQTTWRQITDDSNHKTVNPIRGIVIGHLDLGCFTCLMTIFLFCYISSLQDKTLLLCSSHYTRLKISSVAKGLSLSLSNGSTAPWGHRPPHFSRLHYHTLF